MSHNSRHREGLLSVPVTVCPSTSSRLPFTFSLVPLYLSSLPSFSSHFSPLHTSVFYTSASRFGTRTLNYFHQNAISHQDTLYIRVMLIGRSTSSPQIWILLQSSAKISFSRMGTSITISLAPFHAGEDNWLLVDHMS